MSKIKDIGQEIVILRASAGWTQQQLAEKLETSQRTVATWETGESIPRKAMQVKIAQVFDLPGNYLFNSTDEAIDEAEELVNKIESVMYETKNSISAEKKRMCMDAIQEIMDIKK